MECPFELPVKLNKVGHFVCGDGQSYRDLTPRLSMLSKYKPYIVQAINCHEKLVEALENLREELDEDHIHDREDCAGDCPVCLIDEALEKAEKE